MKPVLYRYKDSESVVRAMDGYTPGEGWEPLYSQDQISSAVNAALKAPAPDERVKELEAELAAAEIAIAEYRQQCLDNAAEIARLRSESEERLQNCAALVAEVERLRAAPATAPAQPEIVDLLAEMYELILANKVVLAEKSGGVWTWPDRAIEAVRKHRSGPARAQADHKKSV